MKKLSVKTIQGLADSPRQEAELLEDLIRAQLVNVDQLVTKLDKKAEGPIDKVKVVPLFQELELLRESLNALEIALNRVRPDAWKDRIFGQSEPPIHANHTPTSSESRP